MYVQESQRGKYEIGTCVAVNTELHNSFCRKRRQNCADVDIYKGRS